MKDISELLTDNDFQKILAEWDDFTIDQKAEVRRLYHISNSEMESLLQLWSALKFKKNGLPQADIEDALNKTILMINGIAEVQPKTRRIEKIYNVFSRVAAILILPLLLYTFFGNPKRNKTIYREPVNEIITVTAQPGTVSKVVLPDGTKVYLNSGSSVTYPHQFEEKSRNVYVSGEAYFEVAKSKLVPMVVNTGKSNIKVYGTKFNVHSFAKEISERITLVEGSISYTRIRDKSGEVYLDPGQTVFYNTAKNRLVLQQTDTYPFIAWKDGLMVFRNIRFESVLTELARKYNINIVLKDKTLADIPLDATFRDENVNEVLKLLSIIVPFEQTETRNMKRKDGTFDKTTIYISKRR